MEFLNEEFEQILNIFREESEEILDRISSNFLQLEKNPNNKEYIIQLFRDAHSLKGAARMVGFMNIQNIAHKIEDILGLCKENKLNITPAISDTLLKSVDFLWLLVKNSIQLKTDYATNEMGFYINALQDIISNSSLNPISQPAKKIFNTTFNSCIENVNAIIMEINYVIDMPLDDGEKIHHATELYEKLYEFFEPTEYFDIKELLLDIISKLKFVVNASGILTEEEITEIKENTNKIIENYRLILKDYDYSKQIDFYSYKKTKEEEQATNNLAQNSISQLNNSLTVLKDEFSKLESNNANLTGITTNLNIIAYEAKNENIKAICEKLNHIFNSNKSVNIVLNPEISSMLKQVLKSLEVIIAQFPNFQFEDMNLLEQRITILFQIIDLETIKNTSSELTKINTPNNDALQELKEQTKQNNYFTNMETLAIKTLRVDAHKLDKLANSISELIINKIKLPAQINNILEFSTRINELKNYINKSINYIKYYETKFNQLTPSSNSSENTNSIQVFQKHILYLFQEINKKNTENLEQINNLYNTVIEDHSKNSQILEEIEETIKDIRILPLATIFHMFPRMVRDLSYENGKDIELEIVGNETSVDKKIVEEIKIPLVHILRNAVDHGIETPDERIKANKPTTGKIKINAYHEYNKIVIEISDDGRGLDIDKIRIKAIEKGLVTEEEISAMTDEQIMNLVFYPGFSTEDIVTELSGRGVGLDIVQTKITQLNGSVKILSALTKGCTVKLELPITTATLKTFTFKINDNYFAIPVDVISSLYMLKPSDIVVKSNKKYIIKDNETIPVFWLSDILGINEDKENLSHPTVIIVNNDNLKIGYIIKNLEGDEEIILRKFTPPIFKITNLSGLTTLVNGDTCLVLNMHEIIKNTNSKKQISPVEPEQLSHTTKAKTYRILVLDDSATTRSLLKNILDTQNYQTDIAPLPSIAMDLITKTKFDLIVTDMEMPEMNGIEFIKKVREQTLNLLTPIAILSSYSTENLIQSAKNLGIRNYFSKNNFDQQDFIARINYILKGDDEQKSAN